MDAEQEKMWKKLNYVKPELPWGLTSAQVAMAGRAFGKTTMAMQSFGRAMRKINETKDTE